MGTSVGPRRSESTVRRWFTSWLLPRYATGALPTPLLSLVRRALRDDDELAACYHALRAAERCAADRDVSAAQLELLLAGVMTSVDAAAQKSAHASAPWMPATAAAAAAAAAVLFVVVGRPSEAPGLGEVTARAALRAHESNAGAAGADGHDAPAGVRVRCITARLPGAGHVTADAVAGARQSGGVLNCGEGELLAFSLTNLAARDRAVFVVGIDPATDERVWLAAFPRGSLARAVPAGTVEAVVDVLTPMAALPARLTLHVLLADAPFSSGDVEARLSAAARSAVPLRALDRLPVDVQTQARLTVQRVTRAP